MQNVKDYKAAIIRKNFCKGNSDHTPQKMDEIAMNIPIRCMKDCNLFADYCKDNALSSMDCSIILQWAMSQRLFTDNITAREDVTYRKAFDSYEVVRVSTIILHRVNYILHECMCEVYNLVDSKLRFASRKAQKNAEEYWDRNLSERRRRTEKASFATMLDHLRIANDAVSPFIENVYEAIRDNMIFLNCPDVEVRARCVLVFLMGMVAGHTRKAFFKDFEEEFGVNYSECFVCDDMQPMVVFFAQMCNLIGISVEKDKYGYWKMKGYEPDNNLRFKTAWKRLMSALKDNDLMDETAQRAISLNPAIKEDYERVVAESNELEMQKGIELLSRKYNVKQND